jgi:hypothetical protein
MAMISAERRKQEPKKEIPPLCNGDTLDQKTFHERYEAMPEWVRAELIGGIVYMSSPQKSRHSRCDPKFISWIDEYADATPGIESLTDATHIMGRKSEAQPDGCLRILSECGGQSWEDDKEFFHGAPEWAGEISDSSESIDLHGKKLDYEKAGVREYMVAAVRSGKIYWFIRRRGKFKKLAPGADGIIRSEVFPGLWLDPEALLNRDRKRLLAVLRQGLASPEHVAFVAKLASKNS